MATNPDRAAALRTIKRIARAEIHGRLPDDARSTLRDVRRRLQTALQSGDLAMTRAQTSEARRVSAQWIPESTAN